MAVKPVWVEESEGVRKRKIKERENVSQSPWGLVGLGYLLFAKYLLII